MLKIAECISSALVYVGWLSASQCAVLGLLLVLVLLQVDLVAVDSVAALLPRSELEGGIGDQQVGLRPSRVQVGGWWAGMIHLTWRLLYG